MQKLVLVLVFTALAGCAGVPEQKLSPERPTLILVLVGGNSESLHHGGIRDIYGGKSLPRSATPVVADLAARLNVDPETVSVHYFSWTGDQEEHKGFLPGHWNWIRGGSGLIQDQLPALKANRADRERLAIVGWSNGGATAYELACDLSRTIPGSVGLLVTLDPVAWSTSQCADQSGNALKVAGEWINVYTHSTFSERFKLGNVVALVGRAWNDTFPPQRADDLLYLENANHGDVVRMWNEKVLGSVALTRWAGKK
jgi:hypothetical protein